ncbi:hypothetical protein WKW50_19190 [Ochrobactrum sp. GPK 3]|uniref:hypothetical protein n=1 Tax=Brucella sp. 22210 TaxID=3453892 RepID=UPI0031385EAA
MSLVNAQNYLERLQRFDLAKLLELATGQVIEEQLRPWHGTQSVLEISAPQPYSEALSSLPEFDRKRIAEAICASEVEFLAFNFKDFNVATSGMLPDYDRRALLPELIVQREVMISVATGGSQIQDVNDYYKARQVRISSIAKECEFEYANGFSDLWDWYHYYKEHLQSYQDRRTHIRRLFEPLISSVTAKTERFFVQIRETSGWDRVDRAFTKARQQLETAKNEEDFQAVGLLCREALISLGQEVFDPTKHESIDGVAPSKTDAKRMLEAFLHYSFSGASFKEVRAHAKASIDLTLNLQHRRTATKRLAELCLEATGSTVAVFKILSTSDDEA